MSQTGQEVPFDPARFVLGYLEHEGSVVAPPIYGVHETLLPDELALQMGLDAYLRLAFDTEAGGDALHLSVNHPLVETIAERVAQAPGNALVYINHVRLEKKGLFDAAAKALTFPNARLGAKRDAVEQTALHHYLRCNFKATFLGDEKQEQIVSVVLDVQGGYAVHDAALLERLVSYETEPEFTHLAAAQPRWPGASDPLAPATLRALLPRAQAAAEAALADRLAALGARTQRLLELDLARIEEYYDSLERDLGQRLARTEAVEVERRSGIESKLTALRSDRSAKLDDIRARHQLRIELEMINVLLTAQPKVLLPVEIGNRRVTITRSAVWDPLMHRLEPLVCDVCGEPGEGLHLCTGGHLAHRRCLAPQCVECNREYCRLCADQVLACVVCQRPVCRASSRTCDECGRITCSEHPKLCHAADGLPASLPSPAAAPAPAPEPKPVAPVAPPARKAAAKPTAKGTAKPARPPARPGQPSQAPTPAPAVTAVRLNVEIDEDYPRIAAFVMRSTNRALATRTIELTSEGIGVECHCEKSPCPENGWLHRPAGPGAIQEQVKAFLTALRQEYRLPPKRVSYFYTHGQQIEERQTFILPAIWREPRVLSEAQQAFDERGRRR